MTAPTTASGKKVAIYLHDGTSYVKLCGITSRRISLTKNLSEDVIPDCDDADVVPSVTREATSKSAEITGSGKLAVNHLDELRAIYESDTVRNWRLEIPGTGANGGGYWQGAFHLANLTISGENGQQADVEVTLSSTGAYTWTAAS